MTTGDTKTTSNRAWLHSYFHTYLVTAIGLGVSRHCERMLCCGVEKGASLEDTFRSELTSSRS
jgi:hypothetical protein